MPFSKWLTAVWVFRLTICRTFLSASIVLTKLALVRWVELGWDSRSSARFARPIADESQSTAQRVEGAFFVSNCQCPPTIDLNLAIPKLPLSCSRILNEI